MSPVPFLPRAARAGLVLAVALLAAAWVPAAVHAAPPPVDLRLGGAGATSWHIEGIKPGDRGAQMLTLRNDGTAPGAVTIWVSDIQDTRAVPAPNVPIDPSKSTDLSDYLLFRPVSSRLATSVTLPTVLGAFPQAAADADTLTMSPLGPGETVDLTWEWRLPEETGNEVQGQAVSFTLNYSLTEMPVVPGSGTGNAGGGTGVLPTTTTTTTAPSAPKPFVITSPEQQTAIAVFADGTVAETRTALLLSGRLTLTLERGTQITTDDLLVPSELRVTVKQDPPPVPEGFVVVGPVFEMLFYTADVPSHARLSQPARIIIDVDPRDLPANIASLFVATWDETTGSWTQLQPLEGFIAAAGELGGLANHFSLFTVIAKVEPPPSVVTPTATTAPTTTEPVITPPPRPLLPARFTVSRAELPVASSSVGQPVTLRVNVANTGELAGETLVSLKVNGLLVENRLLTVQPGELRNVTFLVMPRAPGVYAANINGVTCTFTVVEGPISGNVPFDYWHNLVFPVGGGLVFVMAVGLVLFARRKKRADA